MEIYNYQTYIEGLKEFFHQYEMLKAIEDLSNDYTKSSEEIKYYREQYLKCKSTFDKNCNGRYIQFPVINRDGTHEIQQKKVEEGCFEYLRPYIDVSRYPTYIRAVLALRKDLDITTPDYSLCCSDEEYDELKLEKLRLEEEIKNCRDRLALVKSKINDYKWVHNIIN